MALRGVIFDIDGTMVDSVDLHAKAWQQAFAKFGHVIDLATVRSQIGKGGDQLMPVFLSADELQADGRAIEEHRSTLFKAQYLSRVTPFPDVRALFARVRSDGLRVALASSAKGDELEHYKQLANVADLLDAETSSDDAARSKPHPDIFAAALQRLGLTAADAIAIGDTPYDAEAAAKLGMPSIGVLCGGFAETDLRRAGCVAVFRDPQDLLRQYDRSPLAAAAPD